MVATFVPTTKLAFGDVADATDLCPTTFKEYGGIKMSPQNGIAPQAPELHIVKLKDWIVQSTTGVVHGPPARTKEEAEDILQSWKNYYSAS